MGKYKKVYKCAEGKNPFFAYQPHYKKYKIVDTVSALKKLARKMEHIEEFAFDTETNTLRVFGPNKDFSCVCITISWGEYDNYYIPMGHRRYEDFDRNLPAKKVRKYLGPIFERPDIRLIGQNIKFDLHVLARIGIHPTTTDIWDTMILSWLCDENTPNGLKENSAMKLGLDQTHFTEVTDTVPNEVKKEFGLKASNKATYDLVLIDDGAPYALDDSYLTWELYLGYINLVDQEKMTKIYVRSYQPFLQCLFKMEERGVTVDTNRLAEMSVEIDKDMEDLEYRMFELAGVEFNPNSSQHLAELFFGYIKPDPVDKKGNPKRDNKGNLVKAKVNWNIVEASFNFRVSNTTDAGAPSTSADTFWYISQMTFKNKHKQRGVEVAKLLTEYKKLSKLRSAFIDGLKTQVYDDGKAHPSFNIIGTDSGRISCIAEHTPIQVVGGSKPIEEVKPGDKVYCYDNEGKLRVSTVTNVFNNGVRDCVEVKWRSLGTHDYGSLICTPDHRLMLRNGEWVQAQHLTCGDRLAHLRRSEEERPRLYGVDVKGEQEQLFIKREVFHCTDSRKVIHHKDENKPNNDPSNLKIEYRSYHSRHHSKDRANRGEIKTAHLIESEHPRMNGSSNPNYKTFTYEELEELVHQYKGRIRDIPMDFNTFKKKCEEVGFDYKKVASLYQKRYVEVTDNQFIDAFFKCKGVVSRISAELGIGRFRVRRKIKELDLCYNHSVVSVTPCGSRQVYDLEVEGYHNFIASEVCVHNCSEPNLQQLPKADEEDKYQIRSLFIGSVDPVTKKRKKIIACDFSNLEMRVLAHFSEDKNLLEMFASGADTHGSTAVNMFNLDCDASEVKKKYPHLRQAAKVINFLLMYGGGAQRLYDQLKSDHNSPIDLGSPEYLKLYKCKNGLDVAQIYIDKYFSTYSGVAHFIRDQKKFAKRNGYVQTLLRRKRRLPDINSSNMKMKSYAERLAVNSTIQGSAADITSSAQNRVDADPWFLEHRCLMIIQVHDELVFECPEEYVEEAIPRIQYLMAHPFGDNVSLNLELRADADYGDSYQEAK